MKTVPNIPEDLASSMFRVEPHSLHLEDVGGSVLISRIWCC